MSALSGNAEVANPLGYAGSANSGSGAVGTLGMDYNQTQQNSFWSKLGDSFATSIGGVVGKGAGNKANAALGEQHSRRWAERRRASTAARAQQPAGVLGESYVGLER